jgi:hypothetical protein
MQSKGLSGMVCCHCGVAFAAHLIGGKEVNAIREIQEGRRHRRYHFQ